MKPRRGNTARPFFSGAFTPLPGRRYHRALKKKGNVMVRTWLIRIIIAGACLTPGLALADPNGPSWKPELGMEGGITFGGGNLIVSGVTGQPALTPPNVSLYAGNTFFLQGYYRQAIGTTGLSLKGALGGAYVCQIPSCLDLVVDYIGQDSSNTVGNYESGSATADLALEYAWDDGRIGIGSNRRFFNLVNSNSAVYAFNQVALKPAQGWFIEYEWDRLGVRYTHIIYRSGVSNYSLNASNVGIYIHANYHDEDWYPGGKYFEQGEGMARQGLALVFHPKEWGF